VVERKVLEECGVCSCGREVDKYENGVVEDWVLAWLVKYYLLWMKRNDGEVIGS
jgi:hypothetical protein